MGGGGGRRLLVEEAESLLVACFLLVSSLAGRSSIALGQMSLPVGGSTWATLKRLEAERRGRQVAG
jgi:hypothetical protein